MLSRIIDNARLFTLRQRKNELERSLRHWPNSPQFEQRETELEKVINEINRLENK